MNPGFVAGSVRARLLLEHRVGPDAARELARSASLGEALAALAGRGYVVAERQSASLEDAQRSVASSVALAVRLLAAWLPRGGASGVRALGSWFELANIEDRIAYLAGSELRPPFELGVLSSAWHAAASAEDTAELRSVLARSTWRDPGSDDPEEILLALRLSWAKRVAEQVPSARAWAAGAVAVLLAAELLLAHRRFDPAVVRRAGLGTSWPQATTVAELRARLPGWAAWPLDGIDEADELWRAQPAWWRRIDVDARAMTRARLDSADVVVGAVALLALDAVRVNAALAVVALGGSDAAREVLDALC